MHRPFLSAVLAPLAALALAGPAGAVILGDGDGTQNTLPPDDSLIWDNIGIYNTSTAVYLGDGYVLTAAHTGNVPTVNFGGITYNVVPGSRQQLTNNGAGGVSANTDLAIFRIDDDPGLDPTPISSTSPAVGTQVTMIGNGRNRQANLTHWSVTGDIWTETDAGNADRSGYVWAAGNDIRWGTNNVATPAAFNTVGGVQVRSFSTVFDAGIANEAQAATNDSGGGVFVNAGGNWELAGIILGINTFTGQPGSTAVFGNSTVIADLSFYREQIEAIMAVPEPSGTALTLLAGAALLGRRRAHR